jgi:hypothetical protein
MATLPSQFQGPFQAIANDVIEFSSSLDPPQDMSGLQLSSLALLNRILICRSEDSSTSPIFSISRTAAKPCNTTLVPREYLGLSNHRPIPITSVKPYQPNRMMLLRWLARQKFMPHESRSIWSLQQVKVGVRRRRRHIGPHASLHSSASPTWSI